MTERDHFQQLTFMLLIRSSIICMASEDLECNKTYL